MPRKGQISSRVYEKVKLICIDLKYEILEYSGYNFKMGIRCEKHGEGTIRVSSLLKGSICKLCANEKISKKYSNNGKTRFINSLDSNTVLEEGTYINSITPVELYCKEHKEMYLQCPRDYTAGWRGCNKCRRISIPESRIMQFLDEIKEPYVKEKTFGTCINPLTGRKLPFDFLLTKHNTLLEYDGEQHFREDIGKFKTDLKKRKYLDKLKTTWADNSQYRLVRIPYWELENFKCIIAKTLRQ